MPSCFDKLSMRNERVAPSLPFLTLSPSKGEGGARSFRHTPEKT